MRAHWPWGVLIALSAWLLLAAATVERRSWSSFMGDEATYAMQAESLAFDFDLRYSARDFERLVEHWGLPPQGLILQSGDGGATITYGKPIFYPLVLAPFVRLSPTRGPFVANALVLVLTVLLTARALARRLGKVAPLWVAALVFASVAFAFTFWIHADLFLMCLTALALGLAFEGDPGDRDRAGQRSPGTVSPGTVARWALVGALLAVVAFSRPLYAPLFLPAMLAVPRPRRRAVGALLAMLLSAGVLIGATASLRHDMTGSWTSYGALRSGFYQHTGYPEVDFPAADWIERVKAQGNAAARSPESMLRDRPLDPSLLGWNGIYFLVGRHVGLMPYFLPVLLAFVLPSKDRRRLALLLAAGVAVALFLWSRPFNFYGGGGTLANRYFLPVYPALWFLAGRRLRPAWVLLAVAGAALFLYPLWLAPRAFPIGEEGSYRYVSPVAEKLLPYETTQSHLRLAGRDDLYDGFYLRLLSTEFRRGRDGYLRLPTEVPGELLLGSVLPLDFIDLEIRRPHDVVPQFDDGSVEPLSAGPDGRRFRLHLDSPRARHPMWWTPQRASLYDLTLSFDELAPHSPSPGEPRRAVFRLLLPDQSPQSAPPVAVPPPDS